jgi:DNA-binding beta-propeller fold protein YncE
LSRSFFGLKWVWATNTVVSTVDLGEHPSSVAFNPSINNIYVIKNIYVANVLSDDVTVIETMSSKPIVDTISNQSISIRNLVPLYRYNM